MTPALRSRLAHWTFAQAPPLALPYILDGHTPVPCADVLTWCRWFGTAERHVAETWLPPVYVSTTFLGLDHRWAPHGPPILFETMVFWDGAALEREQERYATWED